MGSQRWYGGGSQRRLLSAKGFGTLGQLQRVVYGGVRLKGIGRSGDRRRTRSRCLLLIEVIEVLGNSLTEIV